MRLILLHPANAKCPTFVTLFAISTFVNFPQSSKALSPILVTPFFITTFLMLPRAEYHGTYSLEFQFFIAPFPLIVKVPLLSSFQVTFFPHFPDVTAITLGDTTSAAPASLASTPAGKTLRHRTNASSNAVNLFPFLIVPSYSLCWVYTFFQHCSTSIVQIQPFPILFSPIHLLLAPIYCKIKKPS